MKRAAVILSAGILLAACSAESVPTTSTTAAPTSTASTTTTKGVPSVNACDPPGFLPIVLPARVAAKQPASPAVLLDQFTTLPGTTIRFWAGETGSPVMVMIRGALPPEQWTAAPEHVQVRGIDAALGPLQDGVWAVAWFEGPDTCDEYSLIFYPPVDLDEVRTVAKSVSGAA